MATKQSIIMESIDGDRQIFRTPQSDIPLSSYYTKGKIEGDQSYYLVYDNTDFCKVTTMRIVKGNEFVDFGFVARSCKGFDTDGIDLFQTSYFCGNSHHFASSNDDISALYSNNQRIQYHFRKETRMLHFHFMYQHWVKNKADVSHTSIIYMNRDFNRSAHSQLSQHGKHLIILALFNESEYLSCVLVLQSKKADLFCWDRTPNVMSYNKRNKNATLSHK